MILGTDRRQLGTSPLIIARCTTGSAVKAIAGMPSTVSTLSGRASMKVTHCGSKA